MSQSNSEVTENSISEQFAAIWRKLNHNQRRFVVAALEYPTKKEAAQAIGIEADTVYRWPETVDEAVQLASDNIRETAIGILAESLTKAVMVKIAGLDSDDEKIRHIVATEIIDRMLGKATQAIEHTGKDGGAIKTEDVTLTNDERIAKLAGIFDAARTRASGLATESD